MKRADGTAIDAFLREVRSFIDTHWQAAGRRPDHWRTALERKGWQTPGWAGADGGCGWSAQWRFHWQRECLLAGAPLGDLLAVDGVGPLIARFAHRSRRDAWLAGIAKGHTRWCLAVGAGEAQPVAAGLDAEPDAEADDGAACSAALQTRIRAQRFSAVHGVEGAGFELTGPQRWVPSGAMADFAMVLAAWPERRAGVALLVVPLSARGVMRRPVAGVQDVALDRSRDPGTEPAPADALIAFDGVRLDAPAIIGPPDAGLALFEQLRGYGPALDPALISAAGLTLALAELDALGRGSPAAVAGDGLSAALRSELEIDLLALTMVEQRLLSLAPDAQSHRQLELWRRRRGLELRLRIDEALVQQLGYYALPFGAPELLHNEGPVGPPLARARVAAMLRARGLAADYEMTGDDDAILARALSRTVGEMRAKSPNDPTEPR